ncbi:zinc metallochaperone AztD [Mycobacterium deserti]|uniref:Zinc metallochaperone AztD n=1 Tax=Mycobacterium deserti TaxID=2978347 RepID=A0ABT2M6M1_9MYCO|nr:zinc metallochaperone AztD [Mycobacterium deserti]MCT7657907.1 zinc metallochaperone AztD [Mycobacterium deserti]
MNSKRTMVATSALAAALTMAACGAEDKPATDSAPPKVDVAAPVVATYDGGLLVIDGESLEVKADIPMDGFLRVNPAGDTEHVLVSTSEGFQVLDAANGQMTDTTFAANDPGHVVPHGENTVLFADGSGEITVFDPHQLTDGSPKVKTMKAPQPHHGVAVVLSDGTQLRSDGNEDTRSGAVALDASGKEIARSAECPGIHGEAVVAEETAMFGCENGVLAFADGRFTKIASPGEYGRVGTIKSHADSAVGLGDFKVDPEAELERTEQFALIDADANQLKVVRLPASVSYSWRSLARGPHAEALILGTDGNLYVIDPNTGATMKTIAVTANWTEPEDWQQPRPAVFARGHDIFVTEPASRELHLVDTEAGEVTKSVTLEQTPNEISGALGHEH